MAISSYSIEWMYGLLRHVVPRNDGYCCVSATCDIARAEPVAIHAILSPEAPDGEVVAGNVLATVTVVVEVNVPHAET